MELDIYNNEIIMEHSMNPYNKRKIDGAVEKLGHNPSCGDEITVELKLDENGNIDDIAYQGHGCAISKASASLMADTLRGKSLDEAKKITQIFSKMIKREELSDDEKELLEDSLALQNISNMPARVKCATLSWRTLDEIIKQIENNKNY